MQRQRWLTGVPRSERRSRSGRGTMVLVLIGWLCTLLLGTLCTAAPPQPEETLTVAVATFGNERWLPHLYVGAEDVVLKPMYENLLSRDPTTGALIPMLAEHWESLEGGHAWRFYLRKGGRFSRWPG